MVMSKEDGERLTDKVNELKRKQFKEEIAKFCGTGGAGRLTESHQVDPGRLTVVQSMTTLLTRCNVRRDRVNMTPQGKRSPPVWEKLLALTRTWLEQTRVHY